MTGQAAGGIKQATGGDAGFTGPAVDADYVPGYLVGAVAGLLGAARDLAGRGALLFHRRRDGAADGTVLGDDRRDPADGGNRVPRRRLDALDLHGDILGRPARLSGEVLHLARDDREPPSGIARAGGLYRCVERQQIGLSGDGGDQADDFTDLAGRPVKAADQIVGLPRGGDRLI